MNLSHVEKDVLRRYTRAVFHMRAQLKRSKLMPVLGAGVGASVGLPDWNTLIVRIADHAEVQGAGLDVARGANTSRTQMLFQHFRSRVDHCDATEGSTSSFAAKERLVKTRWFSIIRECLYSSALPANGHPYLASLLPIVSKAPLTVNYNFDDYIEELMDASHEKGERESRGYESVWEPSVQYRYDQGVIYHPNGFLPRDPQRTASSWLVFADDEFADQMIDAQQGHYSTLLSHLFRYTALLIGISLDDPTLKHLLRQNAKVNPGHVHYYVSYRKEGAPPSEERDRAAQDSNFDTYNLVTLFLSSSEIAALSKLLVLPEEELAIYVSELDLPRSYTYFLTGAVGAGKTTALAYFKSLSTFDEWIEPKPALILRSADSLNESERREVDDWINSQFRRKNLLVARAEHELCVIDRSLIDPLAFAKPEDASNRATELNALYAGRNSAAPGSVLLLLGNPDVMNIRTNQRHKQSSKEYIAALQERFMGLWTQGGESRYGVRMVDTVDRSIHEMVKDISRIIHLEPYAQASIASILTEQMSA